MYSAIKLNLEAMKLRNLIPMLALLLATAFSAQAQQPNLPPLVTTSGTGEVKVQPDEVVISLGVESRSKTLDEARKQTDDRVAAIINYLKKNGVDSKNIQTTFVNVSPVYTGDYYGQTSPEFYIAQKSMTVTLKDIRKFDEVLAGVHKAGVNRVDGIEFRTSELQKHREQARKLAVQAAKQKAIALTAELGAKAGRVYRIEEVASEGIPRPLFGKMSNRMAEAVAMDAGGPTIAAGQITISATVDVSFIIE